MFELSGVDPLLWKCVRLLSCVQWLSTEEVDHLTLAEWLSPLSYNLNSTTSWIFNCSSVLYRNKNAILCNSLLKNNMEFEEADLH